MTDHDDETIDVSMVRAGLRDLRVRMPSAPEHAHVFGEVLAAYMNDEIFPEAMEMAVTLLMHDLQRGRSGYSIALPAKLTRLPPLVLRTMEMLIPNMLRAAAGPEHVDVAEKLIAGLGERGAS